MADQPIDWTFTEAELGFVRTLRDADIKVIEGILIIGFYSSDEYAAQLLHNQFVPRGTDNPPPPRPHLEPTYTPAKPVVAESNPDKWPSFPGQDLNYRGEADPFGSDEDIGHMGGPR